jgi:hypothetical protein
MKSIVALRYALETKIYNEWDTKWSAICVYDSDKINRKAKFYEALAVDISHKSKITVSRDTVQRFNKNMGGDSNVSLQAFSKYLGFDSFEQFESSLKKSINKRLKPKTILFPAAILTIIALSYQFLYEPYQIKKQIISTIISANQCQFNAFKNLNLNDTIKIDKFYHKLGSARKSIVTLLRESSKNARRIDFPTDNPSFYTIHDARVIELTQINAIIKTTEHWFLKWYDVELKKYTVSYDLKNEQIYELEKIKNEWKIKNNFYEGKATKIDY